MNFSKKRSITTTPATPTPSSGRSPLLSGVLLSLALGLMSVAVSATGLSTSAQPEPVSLEAVATTSGELRYVNESSSEEDVEEARVTLYATSWCGWCRKTRSLLDELKVEYREVDVEKDQEGRDEFNSKTGGRSGVPVLDIAGTIVRGYDESRIRDLVSKL